MGRPAVTALPAHCIAAHCWAAQLQHPSLCSSPTYPHAACLTAPPIPRRSLERSWDGKTLARLAVFVGLVPALVWKATIAEFDHVDRSAGRSQRQMLGSSE